MAFPSERFILEYVVGAEDLPSFEGRWLPSEAEIQADGLVVLLSDGLPVVLRVTSQRGD